MGRDRFAVAAGHRLTAETAAETLRAGGNAVDAAVAGALVACVVEPVLASLLGGGFLMVRKPSGETGLLDFFVQTPRRKAPDNEVDLRAVEADFGAARQAFHIGAGSIAAYGVPRGLKAAHERLGVMPFADLAAPAIRAAREGAPLSAFQAEVLEIVRPIYAASKTALKTFGDGEAPLKAGALYRNGPLADVMDAFAREGDRFLHEGEPAQAVLALDGGRLTAPDLRRYEARWREPLVERRASARIFLNPPPSLGGALIAFALRLIGAEAAPADVARALDATNRARLDAGLAAGAGPTDIARLLEPDLAARYARDVAGRAAATRGTTHISVIDGAGLGAALTLSNGEGCGLVAPGTGLMPNNMLGEEDLVGPDLGRWTPDTRLASMMAPTAIDWPDGRAAILGSGGSNRIRSALAQVVAAVVSGGARLEDAIAAPRLHAESAGEFSPPAVDFEDRLREDARAALLAAYPEAAPWARDSMFFGGVHAVSRDAKGGVEAAGDARRDGFAITA